MSTVHARRPFFGANTVFERSDQYYSQAQHIYARISTGFGAKKDLVESVLERCGMHEHRMASLTGFHSKLRACDAILTIIASLKCAHPFKVDPDEEVDMKKLTRILMQRLRAFVETVSRTLHKKDKYKHFMQQLVQLDADIVKSVAITDTQSLDVIEQEWLRNCDNCCQLMAAVLQR